MVRLVEASLIELWKELRQESSAAAAMVRRRIGDLERRKQRLVEAYIYEGAIDQATYDRELGTLEEALTLANLELHGTGLEDLEIEASLGFASHVLSSTWRLWKESGPEPKRKLQRLAPGGDHL